MFGNVEYWRMAEYKDINIEIKRIFEWFNYTSNKNNSEICSIRFAKIRD